MENEGKNLTIGAFAKAADVNVETIRFYQRKGLLPEPERPAGSIRRYGQADVDRVRFVKSAQRLGFSLDEIAQLLRLEDGINCHDAAEIAAHRLGDVRLRLNDLLRIETVLSGLIRECRTRPDNISCPLIGTLRNTGGPSTTTAARRRRPTRG